MVVERSVHVKNTRLAVIKLGAESWSGQIWPCGHCEPKFLTYDTGVMVTLACRKEVKPVCKQSSLVFLGHCWPTRAPRGSREGWPCTESGVWLSGLSYRIQGGACER